MSKFRSVDFWKESLMSLPDNAFFELLRTVFGKIKTPFSKQVLMNDLEKFLLRDDIKNNINNYINNDDCLIIAAVAVLNEPSPGELEAFFAGELSYAKLHNLMVNLEERFILYRFFEDRQNKRVSRLALNPVLEPVLAPITGDSSLLFPSIAADEAAPDETTPDKAPQNVIINDRILAALLSFVSRNRLFFRSGGNVRQKVGNAAKTIFPDLPLEEVVNGLRVLGLFSGDGETLVPDYQRFAAFGALSRRERMAYCAAGILTYEPEDDNSPWMLHAKLRNYTEIISHVYNMMDTERLYKLTTLSKLTYTCENKGDKKDNDKIIDMMEKTGIIIPVSNEYWRVSAMKEDASLVAIAMDTPFSLLMYPEITYNDAIAIAGFADVVEAGMTVRFEINRDSVVQALNRGFSSVAIIELLQRLSHNRIDENVLFTLRDWEKRYGEVSLRRGLVLTLSPQQRHLTETRPLSKLIVETIAPGVYLLPETAEESAAAALSKAGVAIIARRGESRGDEMSGDTIRRFFQPLGADKPSAGATVHNVRADDSLASILIDKFHSILEKTQFSGEARDELAARIDRRMVLSEAQLKDAVVRYEKLEARGLDYVGKAMIAKQALTMQAPVEVMLPGKQKQERVFGIPKALEKADSESVLVLELLDKGDADDDTMRIPLGKISLLRRIKKSIFEG